MNNNKKRLLSLLLVGSMVAGLSGCNKELASDKTHLDILDSHNESNDNVLNKGVTQEKDVLGEDFKLLINYMTPDDNVWRITDTKNLYISIKTLGLKSGLEVYIDNIHMDTSISSTKAILDGIIQDTMDDRIHNSLMLGFPISDDVDYFGCNIIEGQNSEFVEGFAYGCAGYFTGEIETKRYLESDFLERGVYANKIDTVIDLIIVDRNTNTTRAVSVFSTLLVKVNKFITYSNGDEYEVYEYDDYGNSTKVFKGDEEEYNLTYKKK